MRLVLPLSIPALGAIAIFQFLWVWNDLLGGARLPRAGRRRPRPADRPVHPASEAAAAQWHLLTAGAFITMVVPLVVFLLLQRAFVRGILAGSVKS